MSNVIIQFDKTPSGYGEYRLAPVNGKLLGWAGGLLTNVDPPASTFSGLTDAATADLPGINDPLKAALLALTDAVGAKAAQSALDALVVVVAGKQPSGNYATGGGTATGTNTGDQDLSGLMPKAGGTPSHPSATT